MLHVAFDELAARGEQQVLPVQIGAAEAERHHVLQLIAKSERTAWLVVAGARPEPRRDGLVEQPAVDQEIERIVWRLDRD